MSRLQQEDTYSIQGDRVVVCVKFSKIFKDLFLLDKSIIYEEIENRIVINILSSRRVKV